MATAAIAPLQNLLFLRPRPRSLPLSLSFSLSSFSIPNLKLLSYSRFTAAASSSSSEVEHEPPVAGERCVQLCVKEKKELASYAHSLGKKLKCQQVGKSGVTSSVAASFLENLEANELLKLKVHNSCPGELTDVVRQLEEATGSIAISQIGRSLVLYRPSLRKLKAAQKKQEQRVKQVNPRKSIDKKMEFPRLSGRSHRRSSQV